MPAHDFPAELADIKARLPVVHDAIRASKAFLARDQRNNPTRREWKAILAACLRESRRLGRAWDTLTVRQLAQQRAPR